MPQQCACFGENDYLYGGKEFQAPFFNIPWYDSQARFQTTDGIFVSLDPQCERYYGISPYAYCAGNPVNRVDIDGRVITDYFDSSGEFLYTDKIDNGKIKISSPEIIEMAEVLSTPSEVNSFIADNSVSFHKAYELNIIDQESALKVYEYYNNTGLPLFIDNTISGNFEFNNQGNNHSLRISVNIDKNLTPNKQGFTLDNYFDINNSLNAHEGRGHYNKFNELGIINYSLLPAYTREIEAIQTQMQDPSWKYTTKNYKQGVLKYYSRQIKIKLKNDDKSK